MFKQLSSRARQVSFLILISIVAAWATLNGFDIARYHGDEGSYLNDSAWYDQWTHLDFTSLRRVSYSTLLEAPVSPLMAGLSRSIAGLTLPPDHYRWDFNLPIDKAFPGAITPSVPVLIAGRLPMAWMTFATLMLLAAILLNQLGYLASACVTVFIAMNPSVMEPLLKVMTESPLLYFSILGLVFYARGIMLHTTSKRRHDAPWLFLLAGICIGLSTSSKHNGIMAMTACLVISLLLLVDRAVTRTQANRGMGREILAMIANFAISGIGAFAVFLALNPFLWSNPLQTMIAVIDKRNELSQNQQHTFSSEALISLEQKASAGIWHVFTQDSSLGCDPRDDGRVVLDRATLTLRWQKPTTQAVLANSPLCAQIPPLPNPIRPITLINVALCIIGTASIITMQLRKSKIRRHVTPAMMLLIWSIAVNLPIVLLSPMNWPRYYVLPVVFTSIGIAIGLASFLNWIGQLPRLRFLRVRPASSPDQPTLSHP